MTKVSTHDQLLATAGQLFAEHGFKGTSIKMIAEASSQNIAAVNYHFGSKQNLQIETVKFVIGKIMTPMPAKKSVSPQNLLKKYIFDRCQFLLSGKAPEWYGKLIVRAGFEMSLNHENIELYKPDFDYLESLAGLINPEIDAASARWWAYSVVGQIFFYVFGREMILLANNQSGFEPETIDAIAKHIYTLSAGGLSHEKTQKQHDCRQTESRNNR